MRSPPARTACPVCGGRTSFRSGTGDLEVLPGSSTVAHRRCLAGPDRTRRVPSNAAEHDALRELVSRGAAPWRTGYPDFWWVEGDILCFLEVKPNALDPMTQDQAAFVRAARAQGCRVFRYSPAQGVEELLTECLAPLYEIPRTDGDARATK